MCGLELAGIQKGDSPAAVRRRIGDESREEEMRLEEPGGVELEEEEVFARGGYVSSWSRIRKETPCGPAPRVRILLHTSNDRRGLMKL